jgi:hypothetical protein
MREEFFANAKRDPYTHAVLHYVANAWAHGYEQALRDHGGGVPVSQSHNDRFEMALAWLTEDRRQFEAEMIIALASLGRALTDQGPHSGAGDPIVFGTPGYKGKPGDDEANAC